MSAIFGYFDFLTPLDWHLGCKLPPPTWSAWSGSSAPQSGVPGWARLAAGGREVGCDHINDNVDSLTNNVSFVLDDV